MADRESTRPTDSPASGDAPDPAPAATERPLAAAERGRGRPKSAAATETNGSGQPAAGDGAGVIPSADRYAADRWVELTDPDAPWWVRSTELGLSLQLQEIRQLAEAFQGGEVNAPAAKRLLSHARDVLTAPDGYCERAYPTVAKRLREKVREVSELVAGGQALAAVEGCQDLLGKADVLGGLIADLRVAADQTTDIDGYLIVDELVVLLDAELAYEGYSPQWRARAALETQAQAQSGARIDEAVCAGLKKAGQVTAKTSYLALAPATSYDEPSEVAMRGGVVAVVDARREASSWPEGDQRDALMEQLDSAEAAVQVAVEANDLDAAVAAARDLMGRDRARWELQGGVLVLGPDMFVRGPGQVWRADSAEDVDLRPAGLKAFAAVQARHGDDPSVLRISASLTQLAHARRAPQGAALTDLWTVAETLFGGVADDKPVEVTGRLAGLAEHLFVRDFLRALAATFADPLLDSVVPAREPAEAAAEWAVRCIETRGVCGKTLAALAGAERGVEWVRLKRLLRWDQGHASKDTGQLNFELDQLRAGVAAAANRAYLVRNLFLHQGDPGRAAALSATFPLFARALQAASGFVNGRAADLRLPLVQSELAELQVRHVAAVYERDKGCGPAPLGDFVDLSDD